MSLWRRRLQAIEVLSWLVAAKIAVTLLPFRIIAKRLGDQGRESPLAIASKQSARARLVRALFRRACQAVDWQPTCLVEAAAAMVVLRRHGLEGTLYIGAARGDRGELRAHAWVRCGEVFVTGGSGREGFAVLGTFSSARRAQPAVSAA